MDKKSSWIKSKLPLIAAAFFLAFTVCLYAPLSMYISNKSEFWFNLRVIWKVPVSFFLISFILAVLVGAFLKGKLLKLYLALLFSLALCFYLQGNFLSIKLGIMGGNYVDWAQYRNAMLLNLGIWVLLISVIVFLFFKFDIMQKISMYVSALFGGMQLISLVVLLIPIFMQGDFAYPSLPVLTTKGLYEMGSDENIVVFVLDAFDEEFFQKIRTDAPDIVEDLDGFVFYDNFTSTYTKTIYSMTCVIGGRIFRNELPRAEWVEENAKQPMYYDELTKAGYNISMYTTALHAMPQRIRDITQNYIEAPVRFYNTRTCFSLLYRLVACQYFPDIFKPYVWMYGTEFDSTGMLDSGDSLFPWDNNSFRARLENEGITVKEGEKEYKLIHIQGAHEPYYIDEWGNDTPERWDDWDAAARGSMRIVLKYCEELKAKGVYDNTTIIITADHGNGAGPSCLSNPLFLMKEKGSRGEMQVCSYETGLENYAATIVDLCGSDNVADYGMSILDATEDTKFDRYYYLFVWDDNSMLEKDGNYYLVEYLTGNENNDTSLFRLTNREYLPNGQIIDHKAYCETCQKPDEGMEDFYGWRFQHHEHIKDCPY